MKKQGRNEPCACGSGKKYKKCCGHHDNVVSLEQKRVNQTLAEMQEALDTFLGEKQMEALAYAIDDVTAQVENDLNEEETKLFTETILPWVAMYYKVEGKDTLFSAFYDEKIKEIDNAATENVFAKWQEPVMSVYEITGIDTANKTIALSDMMSDETYQLGFDEAGNERIGDLLSGILVPYYETHQFLFGALTIPKEARGFIESVLEVDFNHDHTQFIRNYVQFLLALFNPNANRTISPQKPEDLSWDTDIDLQVANEMLEQMEKRQVDPSIIYTAVVFWNEYTKAEKPVVTKPGAYAAAVDYYITKELHAAGHETQGTLAKLYGTTAGTISNHNRKFVAFAEKFADTAIDPSLAELYEDEKQMDQIIEEIKNESFESEEAMIAHAEQILQGRKAGQERDVMTLLQEASQTSGKKRQQLLEEVLQEEPTNMDAFILLAQDAASLEEAKKILEKAAELERKELGEATFQEDIGSFWMNPDTRPFMRVKVQLALVNRAMNELDEAIKHAEDMLTLNPNDNQGIRDLIIPLYIETGQYEAAQKIIEKYDESTAYMAYSAALVHYHLTKNIEETKAKMKKAHTLNAYVHDYISGKKPIPHTNQEDMIIGEDSEAVVYALNNIHLWQQIDKKVFS